MLGSRFLAERSFLYFRYPRKNSKQKYDVYVPMLENPTISESQKPNLATYDIIGRPGNVFGYLGSKSREFNLTFKITLPHIKHYINSVGLNKKFNNNPRLDYHDIAGRRFFALGQDKEGKMNEDKLRVKGVPILKNTGIDKIKYVPLNSVSVEPTEINQNQYAIFENKFFGNLSNTKEDKEAINLLVYWVNTLRTSIIGNYSNSTLGPPTIYLNYGTLYNNIPCVCSNFGIKFNENPGFDLLTLTPRQIEVTMTLMENRASTQSYQPFKFIESEGVAGWESVITKGTMDPYNSSFNSIIIPTSMISLDAFGGQYSLGSQTSPFVGQSDVSWRGPNNFA